MVFCTSCLLNKLTITNDAINLYKLSNKDLKKINSVKYRVKNESKYISYTKLYKTSDIISASIAKHGQTKYDELIKNIDQNKQKILNKFNIKNNRMNDYANYIKNEQFLNDLDENNNNKKFMINCIQIYDKQEKYKHWSNGIDKLKWMLNINLIYDINFCHQYTNEQLVDMKLSSYFIDNIYSEYNKVSSIPDFNFYVFYYEIQGGVYKFKKNSNHKLHYELTKNEIIKTLKRYIETQHSKDNIIPNFINQLIDSLI